MNFDYMDFQTFLSQHQADVKIVTFAPCKWIATGELGMHIYCHFINVSSTSQDYFVIGNELRPIGNVIADFVTYDF